MLCSSVTFTNHGRDT